MKKFLMLCAIFAATSVISPAQSSRGPSTPDERARAVAIAHKLEANPTDKALKPDAQWLLKWATEVPDITVSLCASNGEAESKYKYAPELTFQKMASSLAFLIEHPEQKNDKVAQELAGVEGALKAYQSILKTNPKAHSEYWDSLLQKQSDGTLKDFVTGYYNKECMSGDKA